MERGTYITRVLNSAAIFFSARSIVLLYFANIQHLFAVFVLCQAKHRFEVLKELLFASPVESFLFRYLFSIRFISKSVTWSQIAKGFAFC